MAKTKINIESMMNQTEGAMTEIKPKYDYEDEVLRLWVFIRKDLAMTQGKICS